MIFWMDSKEFRDHFLKNESDLNIVNAQYVIISSRIRVREIKDNILIASSILYPSSRVCSSLDSEEYKSRYIAQLEENIAFIASLISGVIKEEEKHRKKFDNYSIIFLCSKNENKNGFLQLLADFIYIRFKYPMYDYKLISKIGFEQVPYDKDKTLKICKEITEGIPFKHAELMLKTESGKKRLINEYKNKSKDDCKKLLKYFELYEEGTSKKEMLEIMKEYL